VVFDGHCHTQSAEQVGHTWVVESGVRVKLAKNAGQRALGPAAVPDRAVAATVHQWSAWTNAQLGRVLGYTATGIGRSEVYQLVTRSWLDAFPGADLAISNGGGFRQEVPPGEITLASVLSVRPSKPMPSPSTKGRSRRPRGQVPIRDVAPSLNSRPW